MKICTISFLLVSTVFAAWRNAGNEIPAGTVKSRINLFQKQEPQQPVPRNTEADRKEMQKLIARQLEMKRENLKQQELLLAKTAAETEALEHELKAEQARLNAALIAKEARQHPATLNPEHAAKPKAEQQNSTPAVNPQLAALERAKEQATAAELALRLKYGRGT